MPKEAETDLLWPMQNGKYLHYLTSSFRWRELVIERFFVKTSMRNRTYVHGRPDMYDYKTWTIIDLKRTRSSGNMRMVYMYGIPRS